MNVGRQLHLFKGKRQRGVALPPPKEFTQHVKLADTLRLWCMPGWLWTHFPSGEMRDRMTVIRKGKAVTFSPSGARLLRMGTKRGFPDFLFFSRSRLCAFLELKRLGETTTDEQDAVLGFLEEAGHPVKVTDSYDEAVTWLKGLGVLRSGIHVQ